MTANKKPKKSVDPYTGNQTVEAEDSGKVTEIMPVDSGDREGKNFLLTEETSMDMLAADEEADAVAQRSARFTENDTVKSIFKDRQKLASGGREVLEEELNEYHSQSPKLTGGDLDASWQSANAAGEETVGGTVPTPDQDVVEDLGKAAGLTYRDDEPLASGEKMRKRDRNRFELDPASEDAKMQKANPEKSPRKE